MDAKLGKVSGIAKVPVQNLIVFNVKDEKCNSFVIPGISNVAFEFSKSTPDFSKNTPDFSKSTLLSYRTFVFLHHLFMIIVIFDSVIISKTDNLANCHNKNAPTATTKKRQLPQRNWANCHNRIEK